MTLKDSTNHKVIQQKPALISVYAEHKKPIIVEIIPSTKSPGVDKMKFPRGTETEPDKSPPTVTSNTKENPKETKVSMDIEYALMTGPGDKTKLSYKFVIILTNISKEDITIPTRSYDGEPCCWFRGPDSEAVTYEVGKWRVGDKTIVPSPSRFAPMILRPGESTEFAIYKWWADTKTPLKFFGAYVHIQKSYAELQNWWHGDLHQEIDLTKKKPYDDIF